jgi:4-hydroxybenzoate polyprenyltransferase
MTHLIAISRPRFWLYELGTYALGVAAGWSAGVPALWLVALFGFFFLFPANLFIYGINDIYDYDTDILNPKKQSYEQTLPKDTHRLIYWICLGGVIPFLLVSFLLNIYATIAFCLFLFFAYFYSAPPIRAKSRPVWDSFFSGAHYTVTGAFGYYLVSAAPSHDTVALGLLAGLLYTLAMHAYSAIPDITADTEAGIRTIATFLGARKTITLAYVCYGIAGCIFGYLVSWIGVVLILPYYILLYASRGIQDEALLPIYTYFPYVNAVTGMIVFWSIILL